MLPRGSIVRYREYYGASSPNVGLKLPAEVVAAQIKAKENNEHVHYGVLDPAAFAVISGPSIAEVMQRHGVAFRRADNARLSVPKRMGGFDQMRARLRGDPDGEPMLYMFETCRALIRTLPMMQHDPVNAEDMDTEGEDHAVDDARYACMSRPYLQRYDNVEDLNPYRIENAFRLKELV